MEGIYIKRLSSLFGVKQGGSLFQLVSQHKDMEITTQTIDTNSFIWMAPSDDPSLIEFFYVISGEIILFLDDEEVCLKEGDSFYAEGLKSEFQIRVTVKTKLLCITNKPAFDELISYQGNLEDLLQKINEKDPYTYAHGRNVMEYSVKIMKEMKADEVAIDNIGVAALFHDIGKYLVPEEILTKVDPLTQKEFRYIMRHPIDSKRLLEKKFGKTIAEIAEGHHERNDGSGYPYGLTADEIPIESKIIGIADTFDAMTSQRSYNTPKTFIAAVDELLALPHLYHEGEMLALKKLEEENKINGVLI